MKVAFNTPPLLDNQLQYFNQLDLKLKLSSGGFLSGQCEVLLEKITGSKNLLVPSATAALEMMALLLEIQPGDEVIVPSYTFVTSASAFTLRGAILKFADIDEYGNILLSEIERLKSKKTKAVLAVHYASHSCDLDALKDLCGALNIYLLEDAAQCIDAYYKDRHLGSIGSLGCLSFHDTKNITSGEGGSLLVNDPNLLDRAEIIRDKGTNRKAFLKGEVDKYTWIEQGSSYCFSEINAAYLKPQLKNVKSINQKRLQIWNFYQKELQNRIDSWGARILTPPLWNHSNSHMFALLLETCDQRDHLIRGLNSAGVQATSHYQPLHLSPFGKQFETTALPNTVSFAGRLLRLPIWFNMSDNDIKTVVECFLKMTL